MILAFWIVVLLNGTAGLQLSPDDYMDTFTNTESYVLHMAEDTYITGNILFSDYHSFKTTDGTTTSIIVGSALQLGYLEGVGDQAMFYVISSFIQLTTTDVILLDSDNHCFRTVDRSTNVTSSYTGTCEVSGDRDGTDALFNYPWAIMEDLRNAGHFFITEYYGRSLRYMTVSGGEKTITTLYIGTLSYRYMVQSKSTGDVYITYNHGVAVYDYLSETMSNLAGSSYSGFVDGILSVIRFSYPRGILFLSDDLILIADDLNNRLRLLDLTTNTISSICSGTQGHKHGNQAFCQLYGPDSLLIKRQTLYVGENQRIRKIQGTALTTTAAPFTHTTETGGLLTTHDTESTTDGNNKRTTGKVTETPILSDIHIAIISGTIILISLFALVAYIVKLRTQAHSANQREDNSNMRMQNLGETNADNQNVLGHQANPTYTTLTEHRTSDPI